MSPEERQIWEDDEDALRLAAQESALEATETGERAGRALWRDRGEIIAQLTRERDEALAEVERLRDAAEAHWDARTLECPECGSGEDGCCVCHQMKRAEAAEAREAALRKAVEGLDLRTLAETLAKDATYLGEWRNGGWKVQRLRIDAVETRLRHALASVPAPTDEAGACPACAHDLWHPGCKSTDGVGA